MALISDLNRHGHIGIILLGNSEVRTRLVM